MVGENSLLNQRYQLEKKIGQGGFARVYLATDRLLKRQVAVKVLRTDLTDVPDFSQRFEQEAQQVAALNHPNILGIYDYGYADETVYIVMPLIQGGTLLDAIKQQGKLSLAQAGKYLQQVAIALDYAHKRGIIHRDVKPHNMLLQADSGLLLLSDFGIAKVISANSAHSSTSAIGTPAYMAPEQLRGSVGFTTDIYALGCVLFQMLTGEVPYIGTTEQVITSHLVGAVPSVVARSHGQVPPAIQPIIERVLAKKPEIRFRTAGELSQAFQAVLNEEITGDVKGVTAAGAAPIALIKPFDPTIPQAAPPWVYTPPPTEPASNWSPIASLPAHNQNATPDAYYYQSVPADKLATAPPKTRRGLVLILVAFFMLISGAGSVAGILLFAGQPSKQASVANSVVPTNTATAQWFTSVTTRPTSPIGVVTTANVPPSNTIPPKATPTPEPPPPLGKVGETASKNGYSVMVNKVERAPTADASYDVPEMEYVFLDVTIVSGGELNLTSDVFFQDPNIKDRDNYLYQDKRITKDVKTPWLENQSSSRLRAGDKVRGWMAFQVRKGADGLVFNLNIGLLSRITLQVSLDDTPPTTPNPPQAVGTEGKLEQVVGLNGNLITINKIETGEQLPSGRASSPTLKAQAGKKLVALEITFENSAAKGWLVNYNNLSIKDSESYRYTGIIRREPTLAAIELPKGTKIRGWIVFEIPKEAKDLVVEYQDTTRLPVTLRVTLNN